MPVTALPLLLHPGTALAPHDLAAAWALEPVTIALLVLSAGLWVLGEARLAGRLGRAAARRRGMRWSFAAGWALLALALLSPLHPLGAVLFSAHMAQHELLVAAAAPLLVLGRPLVPMLWALPIARRRALGRGARAPWVRGPWTALTRPGVAWLVHAGVVLAWHLPALFESSLRSEAAHALQHATFLGSALLFWWAILHGRGARRGYGAAVLYLFGMTVVTGGLGFLLTVSSRPWYPAYDPRAMAAWGLGPLEDQQLAGLIMWIPGGLAYLAAALGLLVLWLREADRRGRGSLAVVAALALAVLANGCDRPATREVALYPGADPEHGREAIRAYGCGACHTVPGVPGASAKVGPSLADVGARAYIAGVVPNTPANMVRWIQDPRAVDPRTAMPDLNVTPRDAQDIASYLYQLE